MHARGVFQTAFPLGLATGPCKSCSSAIPYRVLITAMISSNSSSNVEVKTKNKGNRQPSGFAKPSKVTKELCEFMNKAEGTEIARTEVTRALVAYIKENKLENTTNSKIISPDEKLKTLLELNDSDELTYFTIQKYMNKHFVKEKA